MRNVVLIVCAMVIFLPLSFQRPDDVKPDPDNPLPEVPAELVAEVREALKDEPAGTAERHAGWCLAARDTLLNGDEPIGRLRTVWIDARDLLGLESILGPVGLELFEPFAPGEAEIDRDEYAAAWATLAAAIQQSGN